jgi:hypothetical protein
MARKRKRKALGSTDRTHEQLARDYLRRAKLDLASAKDTESCLAVYGRLNRASQNYARAYEHVVSTSQGEHGVPKSMIDVGQKIHDAVTSFGSGPCMRRSAYDK